MALFQLHFFADSIKKITNVTVFLPNDLQPWEVVGYDAYLRPMKTLYLLHGYAGSAVDWVAGGLAQAVSEKYNLAVVMPDAGNYWYVDGVSVNFSYETYTAVELVEYMHKTFGLSKAPEDNIIGGFSMGGYGAVHLGVNHPDTYGAIIGLSGSLGLEERFREMKEGMIIGGRDYAYYAQIFGELDQYENSRNNPRFEIERRLAMGEKIRPMYLACGTEDSLLESNRHFRDFLTEKGIEHVYRESTGEHDWKFWNQYLDPAVEWALKSCIIEK